MTVTALRTFSKAVPRSEAGPTAPAKGLTLERVGYPAEWEPLMGHDGS